MKTYLTRTRRGERKRRRREHQHNTPGPERADPGKARKKKSGGSKDTEQDQRRGGGRKRLNQPDTAKPTNTSARDGANLPGEGRTHEIGDQWGIVDEITKKLKQDSVPKPRSRALSHSRHAVNSCPNWHKTAFKFQRIRCTTCFTSPDTKETIPAGRGHACCLLSHMSC